MHKINVNNDICMYICSGQGRVQVWRTYRRALPPGSGHGSLPTPLKWCWKENYFTPISVFPSNVCWVSWAWWGLSSSLWNEEQNSLIICSVATFLHLGSYLPPYPPRYTLNTPRLLHTHMHINQTITLITITIIIFIYIFKWFLLMLHFIFIKHTARFFFMFKILLHTTYLQKKKKDSWEMHFRMFSSGPGTHPGIATSKTSSFE